jgi:hypothetical protein
MGMLDEMAKRAQAVVSKVANAGKADAPPPAPFDVDGALAELAAKKGGGGNYKESIVDLLKLLDMDSSLEARKTLAAELGVNAGAHGSAEQNIALHKAVMSEFARKYGKSAKDDAPRGGRQMV